MNIMIMIGGWSLAKVLVTFNQPCGWVLKCFEGPGRGCLNNPICPNSGLYVVCWIRFMCHYELWPTSTSHPSSLSSSLCLARGKHYQKINIPISGLVLQNFIFSGLLSLYYMISLYFRLIIICRFGVICLREDNDSGLHGPRCPPSEKDR